MTSVLVTRRFESDRHTWSPTKLDPYGEASSSFRMSNHESVNTTPDWDDQFPRFSSQVNTHQQLPKIELSLGMRESSTRFQDSNSQLPLSHVHGHTATRQAEEYKAPTVDRPSSSSMGDDEDRNVQRYHRHDSVVSTESIAHSHGSLNGRANARCSTTSPMMNNKAARPNARSPSDTDLKDEEDDDMLAEDLGFDGEEINGDEADGAPKTDAERQAIRAERRKNKRFRLSHQQTRFLTSEFAKQAHPDAAHRERLSKEIPGLSARQVQVWFQNRRAKIKRLTADDRDRVMKMRAVPDDFDNIQALHSPYGAIHGIGAPMLSPMGYIPGYGDQNNMRPLLVDTMRRPDVDDRFAASGLNSSFSHVNFTTPNSAGTPEMLSPASLNSGDRFASSMMNGPRSSGPFVRQNSFESNSMQSHGRLHNKPLQPLQLRETMSRSRSESMNSPLRSSMSWKGDSLNYGNYPDTPSPALTGRQQSLYQPELGMNSSLSPSCVSGAYPGQPSPPNSTTHSQHGSAHPVSRYRSATTSNAPNLELRDHYRALSTQPSTPHGPMTAGLSSTPRHTNFPAFNSGGFQSAPLLAPADFQLPQGSEDNPQSQMGQVRREGDYSLSQLSAPMSAPQEFGFESHGQGSQMLSPPRASRHQQYSQEEPRINNNGNNSYQGNQSHNGLPQILEHSEANSDDVGSAGFVSHGYGSNHSEDMLLKRSRSHSNLSGYQTTH